MRFLGLTLPPLTLIMLLAFLWLILLVLLLWVWLRPRRPLEHTPRRTAHREPNRDSKRGARLEDDTPAQLPRPRVVREVARDSDPKKSAAEEGDPFDAYKPNGRNDDFDF